VLYTSKLAQREEVFFCVVGTFFFENFQKKKGGEKNKKK
jgi:hypothetical protein